MPDALKWVHNKQLIFDGGNEYRKFEMLDVNHTTMGLESVNWDGNDYHAYIWTDERTLNPALKQNPGWKDGLDF